MMTKYNIKLKDNYNDCGTMIYDLDNQPVLAGGSGPVCSFLVVFGYIYKEMLEGKYKKSINNTNRSYIFSYTCFSKKNQYLV